MIKIRNTFVMIGLVVYMGGCQIPIFPELGRKPVQIEFREVDPAGQQKGPRLAIENGTEIVPLSPHVIINTSDILSAHADLTPDGALVVNIFLNRVGAQKLGEFTAHHRMGHLGIIVDGRLLTIPVIKSTLQERVSFMVQLKAEIARQLADKINKSLHHDR